MQHFTGYALFGTIVFGFLASLHVFVWYHQRTRWSLQFSLAYVLIGTVYALDTYLQPVAGRPNVYGTLLAMPAVITVTFGLVDYAGITGRAARLLRYGAALTGLVFVLLVAQGAISRLTLFSGYGALLLQQSCIAFWAMLREPRSGHGFVFFALMLYPGVLVAVALGWVDVETLRYIAIAPSAMLGTTVLTTGLVRAQRRASEELLRRSAAESQAHQLAYFDPLTELPNRRMMMDQLHMALRKAERTGSYGALLFIDLDNFKDLNDSQGHGVGDELLRQVASRLRECIRKSDAIARLGGDEFVVILEELSPRASDAGMAAETVGKKLLSLLGSPYELSGAKYHSTCSIGLALFRGDSLEVNELFKQADLAMYQSKAAGRNTLRFFDASMQASIDSRLALDNALRDALLHDEFVLYYQPQIQVGHGVSGAEVLLRWNSPSRGLVSPAEFIPLAEASGLILPLGEWVLRTACMQLVAWAADPATATLNLSVNVSTRQFRDAGFTALVLAVVNETGVRPERLTLEITESVLAEDMEDVIAKMTALKQRGIGFSLDDFGTGYSSLSYLKRLPLDELKIDQSFVRDVLTDSNDATIARIIITLGQELGLNVMAEGVETEAQRDFLIAHGCVSHQGYFFGKPVPVADFDALRRTIHARTSNAALAS